jgi:hypothetical protein
MGWPYQPIGINACSVEEKSMYFLAKKSKKYLHVHNANACGYAKFET